MMTTLAELNALPLSELGRALERCCGSRRWVDEMCRRGPFASRETLFACAEECADALTRTDWLEAFSHHPKIGEKALAEKFAATREWSAGEQAGVSGTTADVIARLARGNDEYETRFGFIFIVCATGKSAAEMLALLEARLLNSRDDEIAAAAREQRKITRIRLEKLLA